MGVAAAGKSDDVQIYGMEPSILILVGAVEDLSQQAASSEFVLNDGTGRIKAKYFASGSENAFAGIDSGRYVSLAAQLRAVPEPHLSVTAARPVRTADEISYHMIECAHSMLKLQRGSTEPVTPEKKKVSVASEADLKVSPPKMEVDAPKGLIVSPLAVAEPVAAKREVLKGDALRDAVLKFLQDQNKPEGVSLVELHAHFSLSCSMEVTSHVKKLAETGDAYNTIDDNHFAII